MQPYVGEKEDVAKVDASRMVTDDERKQSNMIRHVEPMVSADSTSKKVSDVHVTWPFCSFYPLNVYLNRVMMKFTHRFVRSMQSYQSVLGYPAIMGEYNDS